VIKIVLIEAENITFILYKKYFELKFTIQREYLYNYLSNKYFSKKLSFE